jgi:predicted acyltransferase
MQNRLIALDAFRGLTIAAMILVNFPGSWNHVYSPLLHAEWNGLTPTDLIFPFFLFIVGVAISLSYTKQIQKGVAKLEMFKKLLVRSVKIFFVGVLLNMFSLNDFSSLNGILGGVAVVSMIALIMFFKNEIVGFLIVWAMMAVMFVTDFIDFDALRVVGVLQRIAFVFLLAAIIFINTKPKSQFIIGLGLLVFYHLSMMLFPVPEIGAGVLEAGHNFAAYIDSFIVPGKMYQITWDPEGFYSNIPAISTAIAGMLFGSFVQKDIHIESKLMYLFSAGFSVFIAGIIWSWFFPINKNLWSPSYVLVTAGLAVLFLSTLIVLIDVMKKESYAKFGVIYGSNAISVYVISGLAYVFFFSGLNEWFLSFTNEYLGFSFKFASMIFAISYVLLIFIPAYILNKRKIFIKL